MLSTILILLLCAPIMDQGSEQVLNVAATVGGSVLIPCLLPDHPQSLTWFLWQEDGSHNFLFHWIKGQKQDEPKPQYEKYRGRCRVFDTEFNSGNISVRLDNVAAGDDQKTFWAAAHYSDKMNAIKKCDECCRSKLQVSAPYQDLVLTVNGTNATCRAHGGYPEPKVSWTGRNKSSSAEQNLQGVETSLQEDPTKKTFSVTSSVSVEGLQSVTCIIYNPHSNRSTEKTEWIDGFDEDQQEHYWYIVIPVIIIIVIIISVYLYRRRRESRQPTGSEMEVMNPGGQGP